MGRVVHPVKQQRRLSDKESKVELGVLLAKAVVGTGAEHEVVLRALYFSIASIVTLRVENIRVLVDLGIPERHVGGGDDHGALGNGVCGCDRESLLDNIGNHQHRRAVAQEFTDNGTGIGHRLKLIHVDRGVNITVADLEILLTDAVEDIGALGHDLEEPSGGAAGGILGSEQESEDGLGDLVIGEIAEQRVGLLHILSKSTSGLGLSPLLRLDHLLDPSIHDAGLGTSGSHADLALRSTLGELGKHHVGGLLSIPGLGEGDDDGEVDELESGGDEVVVISNLLDSFIGDIVADEGAAGNGGNDLTEFSHERNGFSTGFLGHLEEALEVSVVHLLLARKIDLESLAREQSVQTLAELYVGLAVQEHPVVGTEELVGDIDDAGLDKGGSVEHLTGHITGRGNDDKPAQLS